MEGPDDQDWLTAFYVSYWGRCPDPEGLSYWGGEIQRGAVAGPADAAENFALSPEAKDAYPYFNAPHAATQAQVNDFVRSVYTNLLNLAPAEDDAGVQYWVGELRSGATTPGAVIGNIIYAALVENKANWQTIRNKIQAGRYFAQRFASLGLVWNTAARDTARHVLEDITQDPATVDNAKGLVDRLLAGQGTTALAVAIEPEAARAAGAQWRRTGESVWRGSGERESDIPPGTYRIEFREISGWTSPALPTATVTVGPPVALTGHYAQQRGAVLHVDDGNQGGTQDGTSRHPFASVQAAVAGAQSGDVIKIAVGAYGHVDTTGKSLTFLGGYPGGSAAAYAAGQGGDFSQRSLNPSATVISGGSANIGVTFTRFDSGPYHGLLDNVAVRQSRKGIVCDTQSSWPHPTNLTITNTIVENNGQANETSRGGGILICGEHARIMNNVVRDNHGGRGAGLYGAVSENLLVHGNRIEDNVCNDDHGGGIHLFGVLTLSDNLIAGNRIAMDYGWGGGVLIHSLGTTARMHGNVIRNNYAPTYGGGVFIDEGASASMSHDLVYNNRTGEGIGGGVAVDDGDPGPSHVHLDNCTVAFNNADVAADPYSPGGNGLFVDNRSAATVVNSIFWGHADDFHVRDGSSLNMNYSLSAEGWPGTGNVSADPLFADPAQGDFHPRSVTGRYHPGTGSWVADDQHSPAIDAGDPASSFALEPIPNGSRINLGIHGNTPQAGKSR